MNERRPTIRVALAVALVAMGLIASGLPAQGTQATAPEKTAPAQPPVIPPPADPQKAAPAPPVPVGPIPALPKAGEEIVGRRTERSKTFATDTFGQYRTEVYAERLHFKDANGVYQAIDAELGASKDGVRRSKANAFVLELADDANAAAVARLRLDDQVSVGFAFEGARGVKAKTNSAVSTYAGVSTGVDVRLTSRPDGLKEELILASAAAGDRFVFPLELKGLTAAIDASGDVVYRDKDGTERARTPHGFMTDSAVDPRSGEAPMSLGVTYALVPHAKGTALEVRLDRSWLTDPARAWPVVVDPQLTVNTYGEDTFVMSGFSRDNSYDLELKVGTYDGGAHIGRSFVKFDTASINGKVVNSAQMHIGERHSWNCAYGWPSVHRVAGGWDGRTMRDWPGAPFDPNPAGGVISANGACAGRTVVYDVTSAAAHWAANTGSSHGLVLETNHSDNNAWKKFHSSETGIPPRLEVTWSEPPPPPSSNNPIGYLDAVYPFVNGVWPKGWTIDPNTVDPIWLYLYVDGSFVEAIVANKSRPDVGAAYPGYGNNHGFEDFAYVSPGYHNVCVYGINVGAGTHSLLGCQGVTVPGRSANEPFGYVDAVDVAPGGARLRGWTIDPNLVGPITVQVWADLNYVTTLNANTYRPDVGAAYPTYGNNHGYDSFVYLSPGYHNVCVFAINVIYGSNNPLLGCRQVAIPAANPPAAPTNAVAAVNADNTVKVTWVRSTADGGSPIDYYAIYAYDAADSTWTGAYTVECATCTSTTFTGLALGKSYWFAVYAHNGSAVNGGFSSAAISNTVAIPPATTTTTSSSTTVPPTTTTTSAPPTTTTTEPPTTTTSSTTTTTEPPTTTTSSTTTTTEPPPTTTTTSSTTTTAPSTTTTSSTTTTTAPPPPPGASLIFPLQTTKAVIESQTPYRWCFQRQDNCHHNYNAADIFAPPGTLVVSPVAGVVTSATTAERGSRVHIKADEGGKVWFLTHMHHSPGLMVAEGDRVDVGTPIGRVGESQHADGTQPHLHVDRLPSTYQTRPDCGGESCLQYPFENVQPALIEAYTALPAD